MIPTLALTLMLSWIQVSSNTYVVKSSAGEDRARRVLKQLEGFHQLVGTLVFRATELPDLPIEVLLIGDDETLKDLAPDYNGRKVPVPGYYQRGQDRDFIVLSGRLLPETLASVVYHELTHYFLGRALVSRPTWLSEGLSEYFSTADIRDDEIALGGLSADRMQQLRSNKLIPLKQFFEVDTNSPYYNEGSKANIFYAEAWAFAHFMMHSAYADPFKKYVEALTRGDANLLDYLNVDERKLELDFLNYLQVFMPYASRTHIKVASVFPPAKMESIPEAEAQVSIAEVFLANGKLEEARRSLEAVAAQDPEFSRATYYRGVIARIKGEDTARDFFVDALQDPHLSTRAAVQLVQLGELHIPAARTLLEQAAAAGTRSSDVYWALTQVYLDDLHAIEEGVRLNARTSVPVVASSLPAPPPPAVPEPARKSYAETSEDNVKYRLLSESGSGPGLEALIPSYYPAELRDEKLSGEVVVDIQITDEGRVAGLWLVSAEPEVFSSLATTAIRQWRFEPVAAKIRVVVEFKP